MSVFQDTADLGTAVPFTDTELGLLKTPYRVKRSKVAPSSPLQPDRSTVLVRVSCTEEEGGERDEEESKRGKEGRRRAK